MRFLVYGAKSWVGSYIIGYLDKHEIIKSGIHIDDKDSFKLIEQEIEQVKPDRILCFIGRTSGDSCNSIDYLEDKPYENIRDNLFAPLTLMKISSDKRIHMTYMGTGCIFSYKDIEFSEKDIKDMTVLQKIKYLEKFNDYNEDSKPDFFGSSYSIVKGFTDQLTFLFPNVLNVRIRMPITDKDEPKNFISKIIRYPNIVSKLNSISILPDLMKDLITSIESGRTGTINLVSSCPISHNEILKIYNKVLKRNNQELHNWNNVSERDLNLKSKRSNNTLIPTFNTIPTYYSLDRLIAKILGFRYLIQVDFSKIIQNLEIQYLIDKYITKFESDLSDIFYTDFYSLQYISTSIKRFEVETDDFERDLKKLKDLYPDVIVTKFS